MSSKWIRRSGLAAMIGGVAFAIDGVLVLTVDAAWTNVVYLCAALLMLVGLAGLHALQRRGYGLLGRVGFWTAAVASVGQVLGLLVYLTGSDVLNWLIFPVGFLVVPVGLVLYGIATLRAKMLPRLYGLGLIFVPPIAVVLGDYGGVLFGLLWVVLGYALLVRKDRAPEGGLHAAHP
jgi:hypothetical protein